jgi:hypothetical protein
MWLYGSGFPKSMNISKSLDKRNGRNPNIDFKEYLNMKRKEKNYSLADINKMMNVATNGGGFASSIMGEKENIILPTKENYNKLKKILDLDNRYDELINTSEAEREVIGKKKKQMSGWNMDGTTKFVDRDITAPSTDLAKQWQGWGTALKPSFEPIIVARKPFKGSLVDNVIEYGVGGINIDECRVEIQEGDKGGFRNGTYTFNCEATSYKPRKNGEIYKKEQHPGGRFPANTILTYDETDFDEVCGGFPNTKSQKTKNDNRENKGNSMFIDGVHNETNSYNDSGSASRYYYCAKASKKDRDEGLDEFEEKLPACMTDFRPTLATNPENWNNGEPIDYAMMRTKPRKNTHPTVKPTELMQYLIRLVTPNNGTILDPFNGSGSTGKAVMYENKERNKNYKYIGIELTEEYLPIAKARIEYVCNLKEEELKEMQMSIFDVLESKGE